MAERIIATISGTMLAPGVSGNGNLYTPELIKKAVARMQGRLSDPAALPVVMRSHHAANDDSTHIVGRITSVRVDESGKAKYNANLYDTTHGRDIAALVTGNIPALRSVSIHGWFLGPLKKVEHGEKTVTTASDLEVNAVDFTANPGVRQALLDLPTLSARESVTERTAISESVEATVSAIVEEAPEPVVEYTAKQKKAMLATGQAMRNSNGDASYPIKNKSDLRKAIRAVGRGGSDHNNIRAYVVKRANALGLSKMIPDNWASDGSLKENATRYGEVREFAQGPTGQAGFCLDAYNGPISVTVRSCDIDPAGLRAVTAAAMSAACDALQSLDPDMDADIDVPGDPGDDTDGDMGKGKKKAKESAESATDEEIHAHVESLVKQGLQPGQIVTWADLNPPVDTTQTTPAEGVSTETESEVPAAMSEATTQAAESSAAPTRTLTDDDIKALGALFAGAVKEAVAAVAPVAETAKPAKAETAESVATEATPAPVIAPVKVGKKALKESIAELRAQVAAEMATTLEAERTKMAAEFDARLAAHRDELRESGAGQRKGFTVHENDGGDGAGAAKQPTPDELFDNRAQILLGDFGRTPTPPAASGSDVDRFRIAAAPAA